MKISLRRRSFIKASTVMIGSFAIFPILRINKKQTMKHYGIEAKANIKRVFIFQDRAYFDPVGNTDRYQAPSVMASTRDYLNSVDELTIRKNHWFV